MLPGWLAVELEIFISRKEIVLESGAGALKEFSLISSGMKRSSTENLRNSLKLSMKNSFLLRKLGVCR
jgi:hypothetical protein